MALFGRITLLAALVAAPWHFGSVTPEAQWLLGATIAALLAWHLMETLFRQPERAFHVPTAVAAPLGLLVISAIQLLPREEPLIPRMEHAVFADLSAAFADGNQATGSVSPATTRTQASLLFFALAAFFLAARWFAAGSAQIWLWRALAINGAALGFFGIVQKLTWTGLLFWSVPLRQGGTPFASYVNRNNAAGYLNLCLAAGLGCLIFGWGTLRNRESDRDPQRPSRLPWKVQVLRRIATVDGLELAFGGLIMVTGAALLFSLSRGGILAMLVGFGVVLGWQRGRARTASLLVALLLAPAALGTLIWIGGWESVQERLTSLTAPAAAAAGRLQHWRDTSGAIQDFPVLGTGFGTYRYANLPYQAQAGDAWYVNADNQPFEMLVETGIVGLSLYLAGFLLTGLAAVLLIRKRPPEQRAAGMLGLFAITAQFVQAVTDFGLSMPANALTFAVLCGSVCGTACAAADFDRIQSPLWLGLARLDGRWSLTLLSLVMSLASLAFGVDLFTSTRAAAARNAVIALDVTKPLETRPEALTGAIERAERALRLRPDDPELHRAVALWWIDRYRLTAASELSRAADPAERLSGRRLWQATSLQVLAARALDLRRQGDLGRFDSLRQLPMIRDNLVPARQHLLAAARYGPLSRDVSRYFAELWFLSGEDEELSSAVGTHLKRAVFIAPSSPDQLFAAAMLAERAGLLPLADRAYFRCLTVSDEHILPVWSFISKSRPVEALLQSTIPHRPEVLVTLAEQASDEVVKNTLAEEAERLLNDGEWEDRDSPSNLLQARLAELQGKTDVAIRHYRLALGAATLDIEMRLRLAQLLVAAGHDQEAEAEFSVLHGLAPHRKDLKDQLDALKTRRINEVPNHGQ